MKSAFDRASKRGMSEEVKNRKAFVDMVYCCTTNDKVYVPYLLPLLQRQTTNAGDDEGERDCVARGIAQNTNIIAQCPLCRLARLLGWMK